MCSTIDKTTCECGKEVSYKDSYRCRICKEYYCDKCSLEHYGLYEKGEDVKYKNILKTMWWLIRKRFFIRGHNMPLFDGPIGTFLRKHKIVRRIALVGGALVGLYFLGASQGWWDKFSS